MVDPIGWICDHTYVILNYLIVCIANYAIIVVYDVHKYIFNDFKIVFNYQYRFCFLKSQDIIEYLNISNIWSRIFEY